MSTLRRVGMPPLEPAFLRAAREEARTMVERAKQSAAEMESNALASAEAIRSEAFEEGRREALATIAAWLDEERTRLADEIRSHGLQEMAALAVRFAREIVRAELRGRPEALADAIGAHIEQIIERPEPIEILVHESDRETLDAERDALARRLGHELTVSVDASVAPGDWIVRTRIGGEYPQRLEARLAGMAARVVERLEEDR